MLYFVLHKEKLPKYFPIDRYLRGKKYLDIVEKTKYCFRWQDKCHTIFNKSPLTFISLLVRYCDRK